MRVTVMILTNFVFFVLVLNFLMFVFFHFIRTFGCCISSCVICLMNSY